MVKDFDGSATSTTNGDESPATRAATRMAELQAMQRLEDLLGGLSDASVERLLRWYGESRGVAGLTEAPTTTAMTRSLGTAPASGGFSDAADLYDRANPQTGLDRALVAAYWWQVIEGMEDFDSQRINTELKNLGFPSSNITSDFTKLSNRTPSEVRQVRKEGKSNQARKRYRLTREGVKRVEAMLRSGESR